MKKLLLTAIIVSVIGCDEGSNKILHTEKAERENTRKAVAGLVAGQSTPTDIVASLERHNLIKRAYWVNGMREKAMSLPNPIPNMPLGYAVLLTSNGAVVGRFTVDGKITSLNSYLTPESEYAEIVNGDGGTTKYNNWLPDTDGAYGKNDDGIFFFTADGKYVEWNGMYLYSDIPFEIANPIINYKEASQ